MILNCRILPLPYCTFCDYIQHTVVLVHSVWTTELKSVIKCLQKSTRSRIIGAKFENDEGILQSWTRSTCDEYNL
jgi:hypothetical protein